jgi:hypothetical protein
VTRFLSSCLEQQDKEIQRLCPRVIALSAWCKRVPDDSIALRHLKAATAALDLAILAKARVLQLFALWYAAGTIDIQL